VLAVGAHPDDLEHGCAGTLALWAGQGAEVTLLLLTSGEQGRRDDRGLPGELASCREREQRAAARVLGAREVIFLRQPDGLLDDSLALRRTVAAVIRAARPHRLLSIDPWKPYELHPDHRAAGRVSLDAAFAAKETGLDPQLGRPWRVREAWLYWPASPDRWVDISATVATRVRALLCHASQVGTDRAGHREWVRMQAREAAAGSPRPCRYAEAFKVLEI
jgi:LmbE family N-acetylglucosaminyl deacetylase